MVGNLDLSAWGLISPGYSRELGEDNNQNDSKVCDSLNSIPTDNTLPIKYDKILYVHYNSRHIYMQIIQSIDLIAIDEKVRRGRPYIMGTSITVADIAIVKIYHGQDADGIAAWYDLTLSQVYAALAYYYEHKEEIDEQIRHQIKRSEMFEEGFYR